jgi:uncharacterized protein YbaR (Trm112 family)
MSKTEHETGPQGTLVCPACRQPLDMTVKRRHKTLGVFVPVWGVAPCHNPDCLEYMAEPEPGLHHRRR